MSLLSRLTSALSISASSSPTVPPPGSSEMRSTPLVAKDARVLVVGGGGTMGSSTALHLARRGYTDVRVLDVWQNPSADSAGNDLNKIAGSDHGQGVWSEVTKASWAGWKDDPVFAPFCHTVGKLDLAAGPGAYADTRRAKYEALVAAGRDDVAWLANGAEVKARAPHLADAEIDTWQGLYTADGGYVRARAALDAVGHELRRLGVKTAFGTAGTFKELILDGAGDCARAVGVRAADGTEWPADLVVIAAGAWTPVLIDLEGQCESKCWVYAHIQLTPDEMERLKGIPTVYNDVYGFFMEPSPTGLLKFCNEFPGYTHLASAQPFPLSAPITLSVPRSHAAHPTDTMPSEALGEIERLVALALPWLAGRPLINQAMCWCTDTPDANWLLCEDPRWAGVVIASGDSGHSFATLPHVGAEVADLIEGKMSAEKRNAWRWRPGHGDPEGTGRGGPRPKDLSQLDGWRHDP
ncbi:hypothetical protein Q5752_005388 [Cryptotrichosporon argae]